MDTNKTPKEDKSQIIQKKNRTIKYMLTVDEQNQEIDITLPLDKMTESDYLAGLLIAQLEFEMLRGAGEEDLPPDLLQEFANVEYLISTRINQIKEEIEKDLWPEKNQREILRKKNLLYVYNNLQQELLSVYSLVTEPMTVETITEMSLVQIIDLKVAATVKDKMHPQFNKPDKGNNNAIDM